jgi:hypothetical protein
MHFYDVDQTINKFPVSLPHLGDIQVGPTSSMMLDNLITDFDFEKVRNRLKGIDASMQRKGHKL